LAQRALLVLGGKATTSQVIEWTCCRKRLLHGRRIERTTIAPLVLRSNELRSVSGGEARAVGRGFGGCEMSELGSTIGSGEQRCLAKLLASREECQCGSGFLLRSR
jgi:hypothetical protein